MKSLTKALFLGFLCINFNTSVVRAELYPGIKEIVAEEILKKLITKENIIDITKNELVIINTLASIGQIASIVIEGIGALGLVQLIFKVMKSPQNDENQQSQSSRRKIAYSIAVIVSLGACTGLIFTGDFGFGVCSRLSNWTKDTWSFGKKMLFLS